MRDIREVYSKCLESENETALPEWVVSKNCPIYENQPIKALVNVEFLLKKI